MSRNKEAATSIAFTKEFKRNLRTLAKKYPHIQNDLQPFLDELLQGGLPGDRIQGTGHILFKARLRNRDAVKGKRSGYRVIYYLVTEKNINLFQIHSGQCFDGIHSANSQRYAVM